MGIAPELADCSIRVSLGHDTKPSDIDAFVEAIASSYPVAVREGANQKAI